MGLLTPVQIQDAAELLDPVENATRNLVAAGARSDPLPNVVQERLRARRQELEESRRQLAAEEATVNRELERQVAGGRARAMARDLNQRIIDDDPKCLQFTRTGQNIAPTVALLQTLPEQGTLEAQQAQRDMAVFLARAAEQQDKSSRRCGTQSSCGPVPLDVRPQSIRPRPRRERGPDLRSTQGLERRETHAPPSAHADAPRQRPEENRLVTCIDSIASMRTKIGAGAPTIRVHRSSAHAFGARFSPNVFPPTTVTKYAGETNAGL